MATPVIHMRTNPEQKRLLDVAARIAGYPSLSQFMLTTATERAKVVLELSGIKVIPGLDGAKA